MEKFGKIVTVIITMFGVGILNGYTLSKLWLWFIVPLFKVQELPIVYAVGINMLINFVFAKRDKKSEDKEFLTEFKKDIAFTITYNIIALIFGYAITLFI